MDRLLSIEERKAIMLDLCQAIDDCCRENGIEYSLACGTLLGAYRHKGFIPWDDDLDIMIKRDEFFKLKNYFQHPVYKLTDPFTTKNHTQPFPRVIHPKTFSTNRNNIYNRKIKNQGVFVDIYIVDFVPENHHSLITNQENINSIIKEAEFTRRIHNGLRILGLFPNSFTFLNKRVRKISKAQTSTKETGRVTCFAGYPSNNIAYEKELFDEYIDCQFEGRNFRSIKDYHVFLENRYGDWMQLPPKSERRSYHGGKYYIVEEDLEKL